MKRTIVLGLLLASSAWADKNVGDPNESPSTPTVTATSDAPRHGLHFGASFGGAFLPVFGGTTAVAGGLEVNYGTSVRHDLRFRGTLFYATNDDAQTTGFLVDGGERWNLGSWYSVGLSGILGVMHVNNKNSTPDHTGPALGIGLVPIAARFCPRTRCEAALNLFLLYDSSGSQAVPGGYFSIGYLFL